MFKFQFEFAKSSERLFYMGIVHMMNENSKGFLALGMVAF